MVAYISGLITLVDFDTPDAEAPLASFQIPSHDYLIQSGNEEALNEHSEKLNILMDIDL